MSSRGKKKTTMAKLTREARLRDRRVEKQMRKEARRDAASAEPFDQVEFAESTDELEPGGHAGELQAAEHTSE